MYDAKVRDKARAAEKKRALDEYKIKTGCADCGYNIHPAALEFDHLPEFEKSRNVATLMYNSWAKIWAEVAKCEVVCCNCHAIRTMNRRGLYLLP
jgi:hypothetical protein